MRVAKLQMRIALLAALMPLASSCHTAQKPVSLLPATTAPALTASTAATTAAVPKSQQAQPAAQAATSPQPSKVEAQAPAQAKPEPPAPQAAAPDPVADLIVLVEKDYQTGLDAYHAGQTEAAKQDFDNAFNALLDSYLDVRSDDRLEKEFDHIVEGVNHLDLEGLPPDTEAQKSEP